MAGPPVTGQVTVEPIADHPENPDNDKGQEDEIPGNNRVGNKGIKRLFGKIRSVIERVTLLPPCRET